MDAHKHSVILAFGLFLILFGSAASAFAFSYENTYQGGNGFNGGYDKMSVLTGNSEYQRYNQDLLTLKIVSNSKYQQYNNDLLNLIDIVKHGQRID